MIVVADASPLILLANIGFTNILPDLYGRVIIPTCVAAELRSARRSQVVQDLMRAHPAWLVEQTPTNKQKIPHLHAGETEAIQLAEELQADVLLIDERQGREVALSRNLRITGTIGILELAADRKLLDLKEAFNRVKQTDFWISHDLLDRRLQLHLTRRTD